MAVLLLKLIHIFKSVRGISLTDCRLCVLLIFVVDRLEPLQLDHQFLFLLLLLLLFEHSDNFGLVQRVLVLGELDNLDFFLLLLGLLGLLVVIVD